MKSDKKLNLIQLAEEAWLKNNVEESSLILESRFTDNKAIISQENLDLNKLEKGISATPLYFNGNDINSYLVKFSQAISIFNLGLPISIKGTFFSREFSHLKYPERYLHLYSPESTKAITAVKNDSYFIENTYITLIRKPYYHWLLDTIPHLLGAGQLNNIESLKLISSEIPNLKPWQKQLLELSTSIFKIQNLSWINLNGNIIKSQPGFSQTRMLLKHRLLILRSLKSKTEYKKPWRYIYAKRSQNDIRKLINEKHLLSKLDKRFEIIEPHKLDITSQINLFSEAKCVVGVCGSNLTNIVFCEPETTVVEIAAGFPQDHFKKISNAIGLNFIRILGTPLKSEVKKINKWKEAHSDLYIKIENTLKIINNHL